MDGAGDGERDGERLDGRMSLDGVTGQRRNDQEEVEEEYGEEEDDDDDEKEEDGPAAMNGSWTDGGMFGRIRVDGSRQG